MRYIFKITAAFFMFVALTSCANDDINDQIVTPATSSVVTSTVSEVTYPTFPIKKAELAAAIKEYDPTLVTTLNWTAATYSGPSVTVRYKVERYLTKEIINSDGSKTIKDDSYVLTVTNDLTLSYTGKNLRAAVQREKLNTKDEDNTLVFRVTSYTGDDTSLSGRTDNLVRSVNFVELKVKKSVPAL